MERSLVREGVSAIDSRFADHTMKAYHRPGVFFTGGRETFAAIDEAIMLKPDRRKQNGPGTALGGGFRGPINILAPGLVNDLSLFFGLGG